MSSNNTINLVTFQKQLFPGDSDAVRALRRAGVTVMRLSESNLSLLEKIDAFKGASVRKVSFQEAIWPSFNKNLRNDLAQFGELVFLTEHETLLRMEKPTQQEKASLNELLDKARLYVMRFCVRLVFESKEDDTKHRIRFHYDENLSNGYAFESLNDSKTITNTLTGINRLEVKSVELNLAPSVKLRFTLSKVNGIQTFEASLLDKQGEAWSETMRRTGKFDGLDEKQLRQVGLLMLGVKN